MPDTKKPVGRSRRNILTPAGYATQQAGRDYWIQSSALRASAGASESEFQDETTFVGTHFLLGALQGARNSQTRQARSQTGYGRDSDGSQTRMSHRDNERVAQLMKDFGDKCAVAKQSLMLRVQER